MIDPNGDLVVWSEMNLVCGEVSVQPASLKGSWHHVAGSAIETTASTWTAGNRTYVMSGHQGDQYTNV